MVLKYSFKVITMGDGAVGKTSLVIRYTENRFDLKYKATLGAAFAAKEVKITNVKINLMIWDLAGQPSFDEVRDRYYLGSSAAILVFDVTNASTTEKLRKWLAKFRKQVPKGPVILVGNKTDLVEKRQISTQEAHEIRDELQLPYFETSCSTGEGVNEVFHSLIIKTLEAKERRR